MSYEKLFPALARIVRREDAVVRASATYRCDTVRPDPNDCTRAVLCNSNLYTDRATPTCVWCGQPWKGPVK